MEKSCFRRVYSAPSGILSSLEQRIYRGGGGAARSGRLGVSEGFAVESAFWIKPKLKYLYDFFGAQGVGRIDAIHARNAFLRSRILANTSTGSRSTMPIAC